MNKQIISIVESKESKERKLKKLKDLIEEVNKAIDIVNGKYRYCPKCKDYYLSKSFISDEEVKQEEICVWEDPINSGGNEYSMGNVKYVRTLCPKGHEVTVDRFELGRLKL